MHITRVSSKLEDLLVPGQLIVLGCDKHSPGSRALLRANRTKFQVLYTTLVGEPDELTKKEKRDSQERMLCTPTRIKKGT